MSILYENTLIPETDGSIIYEGTSIEKVIYDGVVVWEIIRTPPPVILSESINYMERGKSFNQLLLGESSTGSALTWSISGGSLPSGITLSSNGTLSGTPTSEGNYSFTVNLNADGQNVTRIFDVKVQGTSLSGESNMIFKSRATNVDINFGCIVGETLIVVISSNGSLYMNNPTLITPGWNILHSYNGSGIGGICYYKTASSTTERFACNFNSSYKQGTIIFTYRFTGNIVGNSLLTRFAYSSPSSDKLKPTIQSTSRFSKLLVFAHVRGNDHPQLLSVTPTVHSIEYEKIIGPYIEDGDTKDRTTGAMYIINANDYNAMAEVSIPKKHDEPFSIGLVSFIALA